MRRSTARGRVFPQSYSTDRRYGRLSLKACALFPLIWINADDQGRLSGDPEEVKYACCPNIDHITKADIPQILQELEQNRLIQIYGTANSAAIQLLDWWSVQKPQWAWPSEYPPREGWHDRLRYKNGARTVVTENWPSGESRTGAQVGAEQASGEGQNSSQVREDNSSGESENSIQVSTNISGRTILGPSGKNQNDAQVSESNVSGEAAGKTHAGVKDFSPETASHTQVNSPMTETVREKGLAGSGFSSLSILTEINNTLAQIPPGIDSLAQHEAIKQKLADIGRLNGFDVKSEFPIGPPGPYGPRRIDICWLDDGKVQAAFEIDRASEREKSIEKLQMVATPNIFIILREPRIQFLRVKKRETEKKLETEKETERGNRNRISPEDSGESQKGAQVSTQVAKKPPDLFAEKRKTIFTTLKERRGYNSPQAGAEAKAITWMFKQGYGVDQILGAYDKLKQSEFWRDKLLNMQSVKAQIGEIFRERSKHGQQESRTGWGAPAHQSDPLQAFREAGGTVILSGEEAEARNEDGGV